jgi:hypothetical protein
MPVVPLPCSYYGEEKAKSQHPFDNPTIRKLSGLSGFHRTGNIKGLTDDEDLFGLVC